jgi:hypothetical protein
MRRILSLGGGGIKGAATAAYLAHLEDAAGQRIADCFDLIAGTSTGGIIAIALALGVSAKDLVSFYKVDGPKIFPADRHDAWHSDMLHLCRIKYDAKPLRLAVLRQLGARRLGEARTRLVIPAVQPDRAQMYLFKTRHHPLFRRDHRLPALDVALATSAAPSYLPQHVIEGLGTFADGGLWANNPVAVGVAEAVSYLEWDPLDLHVLSVECPQEPQTIPGDSAKSWILGPPVLNRLAALQSSAAKGTALALMRDVGRMPSPERFFSALEGGFPAGYFGLDRIGQIEALIGVGDDEARKQANFMYRASLTARSATAYR